VVIKSSVINVSNDLRADKFDQNKKDWFLIVIWYLNTFKVYNIKHNKTNWSSVNNNNSHIKMFNPLASRSIISDKIYKKFS
jgi:hypothetical protein